VRVHRGERRAPSTRLAAPGHRAGARRKSPVTGAGRIVGAELALLQSERAYVDGTADQDRDSALTDIAIWNACHDPETSGKGDWLTL
jgi:hypothetical protein